MRVFEPWHLIVLVVLVAVLFGSKRLPDAARGLGRSMRIFKAEVKEMREDDGRRPGAYPPAGGTTYPAGGTTAPGAAPTGAPLVEPLEGRVVEGDVPRAGAPSEQRRDL